jgi:hypothetical protein
LLYSFFFLKAIRWQAMTSRIIEQDEIVNVERQPSDGRSSFDIG